MARSNLVLCFYMGKTVRKPYNGRNLQQMISDICLYKNSDPKGLPAPAPGLYIHVYMYKNMKNYV